MANKKKPTKIPFGKLKVIDIRAKTQEVYLANSLLDMPAYGSDRMNRDLPAIDADPGPNCHTCDFCPPGDSSDGDFGDGDCLA